MPLELPEGVRFQRRPTGDPLPRAVVSEFEELIGRVAAQGGRRAVLEHFKSFFCGAIGAAHYRSSDEGWAYTDLLRFMEEAAETPALFIEAFYDACETLRAGRQYEVPDTSLINEILRERQVPFEIQPPRLLVVEPSARVAQPEPPPSLAESASSIITLSMQRAEELLAQNRPREAVQEMLWILESIATTFRGATVGTETVEGRYFNEIAQQLRRVSRGTTLDRVVDWCVQLQGYLSSPTGGGIRHGLDLNSGTPISPEEGRLFCNLILSYVTYLMAAHASLVRHR